jgi:hypothetical protein
MVKKRNIEVQDQRKKDLKINVIEKFILDPKKDLENKL